LQTEWERVETQFNGFIENYSPKWIAAGLVIQIGNHTYFADDMFLFEIRGRTILGVMSTEISSWKISAIMLSLVARADSISDESGTDLSMLQPEAFVCLNARPNYFEVIPVDLKGSYKQ
jgi:hypothetical protein